MVYGHGAGVKPMEPLLQKESSHNHTPEHDEESEGHAHEKIDSTVTDSSMQQHHSNMPIKSNKLTDTITKNKKKELKDMKY